MYDLNFFNIKSFLFLFTFDNKIIIEVVKSRKSLKTENTSFYTKLFDKQKYDCPRVLLSVFVNAIYNQT